MLSTLGLWGQPQYSISEKKCLSENTQYRWFAEVVHVLRVLRRYTIHISAWTVAILTGFLWFSPVPAGTCQDIALNEAMNTFHINCQTLVNKQMV